MALRFWVGGGSTNTWAATANTNWGLTSGTQDNSTVPGSTSDVTFDGAGVAGNSVSVIGANITINSLTFTSGYTQTVTINTAVTLTISGSFTDNTAHSWTVSGTGAMTISASSTITSGGKTFPGPVSFTGSNTKTLSGNWTISGTLTFSSTNTLNWTTNETLTCAGLTMNGACSGTATIILSGGTWSGAATLQNSLTISGNVTISSVGYQTGTLTYSSGTVTTSGSTLTIGAATTLNTNGISWNNITFSATATYTINSLLTVSGTITLSGGVNQTFAGTSGFTTATLTCSHTGASTITLKNSVTYTISGAFNAFVSRPTGPALIITSDDATLKATLTLNQGATCNVLANFTRIDASAGRTIFTFNGTLTSTINITAITDLTFAVGRAIVIQGNSNY